MMFFDSLRKNPFKFVGSFFLVLGIIFLLVAGAAAILFSGGVSLAFLMPFCILGGIYTLLGGIFVALSGENTHKKRARLIENGIRTEAEVVDVERVYNMYFNGRNPYRVVCRYSDGGVNYICRSEPIWEYPEIKGKTVYVYTNPNKQRDYYVDYHDAVVPAVEL